MADVHILCSLSSTCSHTRSKSLSPLSNCFINAITHQSSYAPFLSNALSQLTDIFDVCLVAPFLQYAPDFVVHWAYQVRTIGQPKIWWDEACCHSLQEFDSIVSPMHRGPSCCNVVQCEYCSMLGRRSLVSNMSPQQAYQPFTLMLG